MPEDTQKPNRTVESMVHKIFRYQQRQKYWQIAKFALLTLLIASIGFGLLRQVNQSFLHITKTTKLRTESVDKKHIALIDLKGPILGSFDSASTSTADVIISALRRAFKSPKTAAVILRINSPGGMAVQSAQIYNEILYLRQQYPKMPIYAVCEEICASAAYRIAAACEKIYADSASIIGSLGAFLEGVGFGYEEALKKLGIERRLITAGERKGMLDPYSPLKSEDVRMLKEMQTEVHQVFINDVKQGREGRLKDLKNNANELFSGRIWMGSQALGLGLIDELGSLDTIARELKVGIVDYTPQPDWLFQLRKVAGLKLSMGMMQSGVSSRLIEPLLGMAQPLSGLRDPAIGLL